MGFLYTALPTIFFKLDDEDKADRQTENQTPGRKADGGGMKKLIHEARISKDKLQEKHEHYS